MYLCIYFGYSYDLQRDIKTIKKVSESKTETTVCFLKRHKVLLGFSLRHKLNCWMRRTSICPFCRVNVYVFYHIHDNSKDGLICFDRDKGPNDIGHAFQGLQVSIHCITVYTFSNVNGCCFMEQLNARNICHLIDSYQAPAFSWLCMHGMRHRIIIRSTENWYSI